MFKQVFQETKQQNNGSKTGKFFRETKTGRLENSSTSNWKFADNRNSNKQKFNKVCSCFVIKEVSYSLLSYLLKEPTAKQYNYLYT